MNKKIKVLIVDDEIEACENLQRFIQAIDPRMDIVSFAHHAKEAELAINQHQPDILFLDIEMPHENGIAFLKRLGVVNFETVFVTAYDEYAIHAFKLNAIDYVLKPIKKEYLEKTLRRVNEFVLANKSGASPTSELLKNLEESSKKNLVLRNGCEVHYLNFNDIIYLSAEGSYTHIYTLKKEYPYQGSYNLKYYEELLPAHFERVHRGYIINSEMMKQVTSENNSHFIILKNDVSIPISRRRHKYFVEQLGE